VFVPLFVPFSLNCLKNCRNLEKLKFRRLLNWSKSSSLSGRHLPSMRPIRIGLVE
jgi:hypothetical protein